jgi:hypothetical protein
MARNKSAKQSGPRMVEGHYVEYERETFITICRGLLRGEILKSICAKAPMPPAPLVPTWVQEHPEARALYHSACAWKGDGMLAKEAGEVFPVHPEEWEKAVRARLEQGYPLDYRARQYIPPDWNKVYPSVGDPPVWPTENRQDYDDLLNQFTQMIKPRELIELVWTKEAADAMWEYRRLGRQKNRLPECGFNYYRALDIAQSRAMKRRDHTLREIKRWRASGGGKAEALPVEFIAEQPVAERLGVPQVCPDAQTGNDNSGDIVYEDLEAALSRLPLGEAVECIDMDSVTSRVNWLGWLTGIEDYPWPLLEKAARFTFKQVYSSKQALVRDLVMDRKVTRPERVCPELASFAACASCAPAHPLRGRAEMTSQKPSPSKLDRSATLAMMRRPFQPKSIFGKTNPIGAWPISPYGQPPARPPSGQRAHSCAPMMPTDRP